MSWPLKAARPSGLADVTPRSICPEAKSPGGGCLLPLWACWGGHGPAVCPWEAGRLGKGPPLAGCLEGVAGGERA